MDILPTGEFLHAVLYTLYNIVFHVLVYTSKSWVLAIAEERLCTAVCQCAVFKSLLEGSASEMPTEQLLFYPDDNTYFLSKPFHKTEVHFFHR